MLPPNEGDIDVGPARAVQPSSPTSCDSGSDSRLHQPPVSPGSGCSTAETRQLEWDSSFDFTARYPPVRAAQQDPPEERQPPCQPPQSGNPSTAVFTETDVNLVVTSGDSSRSDRTGSTVITLRRQVSFPTISLKRAAGALDGLRGLTILFEGEQPTEDSEASFCSVAPTETQQQGVSRRASRVSQQTEYASLSERLSSASAASQPPPPPAPQGAMSRPPCSPVPPPPLASHAPPSIEKCARWLARHELQVGHGDGAGPAARAALPADGPGRVRGAWRARVPSGSQERITAPAGRQQVPSESRAGPPAAAPEPRRPGESRGQRASPAAVRKALSDPLGGSAAAVSPQPAAKSRSAHAGTAAGMTRQQHAESLARWPRPPPATASRSNTETATAPSVPSLHYLQSAESDELIRRWRQDRKDFYQLAYLRRGDCDPAPSPADDSGFSSSVLTQRHAPEVQVYTASVPAVPEVQSAVPAVDTAEKLGSTRDEAGHRDVRAIEPSGEQERRNQTTVLVPPRSKPLTDRPGERVTAAASGATAAPTAPTTASSSATATAPAPSQPRAAAESASRTARPQTAPASGRPGPTPSGTRRPPQQSIDRRRSPAAPGGSVWFSPSTQSVGRGGAVPVTPRPGSAAAVRAQPSRLGRTRSSTFTMAGNEERQKTGQPVTAATDSAPAVKPSAGGGATGNVIGIKSNMNGAASGSIPSVRASGRVPSTVASVRSTTGASAGISGVRSRAGVLITASGTSSVRPGPTATGSSAVVSSSAGADRGVSAVRSGAGSSGSSAAVSSSAGADRGVSAVRSGAGGSGSSAAVSSGAGADRGVSAVRSGAGGSGSSAAVSSSAGADRGVSAVRSGAGGSGSSAAVGGSGGRVVSSAPSTPVTAATDSPGSTSPSHVDSSHSSPDSSPSHGSPPRHSDTVTGTPSSAAAAVASAAASPIVARHSTSPTVRPSSVRRGSLRAGSVLNRASRLERTPITASVSAARTPSRGRGSGSVAAPVTGSAGSVVPQAPRPLSAQPEPNMRRNQPPPRRYSFTPSSPAPRTAGGTGAGAVTEAGRAGGQTYRRESVTGRSNEQTSTQPLSGQSSHGATAGLGRSGHPAQSTRSLRVASHSNNSAAVPAPSPEMHARKSLLNREIESGRRPRLRSVSADRPDDCRPPLTCDDDQDGGSDHSGAESDRNSEAAVDRDPASGTESEESEDAATPELPGGYSGAFRRSVDNTQLPLVRDTIRDYEVRSRSASRERPPAPRPGQNSELTLTLELGTKREPDAGLESESGIHLGRRMESGQGRELESETEPPLVQYSTGGGAASGDADSASEGGRGTPAVPPLSGLTPPDSQRAVDSDPSDRDGYLPGQWRSQHQSGLRRPPARSRIPVRRSTAHTPSPRQPATPPQQQPQYATYELTVLAERSEGRQRSPPPPRRPDDYRSGRQARPGGPPRRRPPPQGCVEQRHRAGGIHSETTLRQRAPAAAVSPKLSGTVRGGSYTVGGDGSRSVGGSSVGGTGRGTGGSVRSVYSAPVRQSPTPRSDGSSSSGEAVYTLGYSEVELRQARLVRRQSSAGRPLRLTLDGDGALEGGRAVVRRLQHSQTQTDEFAHISSLLQLDLFPCQPNDARPERGDT